jgi:hypothetical protein
MKEVKNMVRHICLFITTILLATGCANLGDKSEDLGSGYSYKIDGSDRWINTDHVMKEKIYPNVVDYASNKDFIIVLQVTSPQF